MQIEEREKRQGVSGRYEKWPLRWSNMIVRKESKRKKEERGRKETTIGLVVTASWSKEVTMLMIRLLLWLWLLLRLLTVLWNRCGICALERRWYDLWLRCLSV